MNEQAPVQEQDLRQAAFTRLRKKRDLAAHTLAYVLVNAFLVGIWVVTTGTGGFFWPLFPLMGWGIGLAFNAWDVLSPAPSEGRIRAEMARLSHR